MEHLQKNTTVKSKRRPSQNACKNRPKPSEPASMKQEMSDELVEDEEENNQVNQLILENMDVDLGNFITSSGDIGSSKEGEGGQQSDNSWIIPSKEEEEDEETPSRVLPNHEKALSSKEPYEVDLMPHFNKIFVKKAFNSYKEFDELFTRFKKETGSVFRIKSSCSIAYENSRRKQHFIPPRFKFVSIKYCCVHYGQPKVSGQGIRTKQRYLPCGCSCVLSLAYNRGALFISQVNMCHNHEVSNKIAPFYAINRRITNHELKQIADVVSVMPSSRALQYFLKERFHRPMTLQDAKNTRARLKALQTKQSPLESIKVVPSIKGISQIHNEDSGRAVLEIKAESEVNDKSLERVPVSCQLREVFEQNVQPKEEYNAVMKNRAVDKVIRKFKELIDSCDSSVFWERITVMNKVLECWENGETLDIHYTTDDHVYQGSDENNTLMQVQQDLKVAAQEKVNLSVQDQSESETHLKILLPILDDSMRLVSASSNDSEKVVSQSECKVEKANSASKRSRGRLRKVDGNWPLEPENSIDKTLPYHYDGFSADVQEKNGSCTNDNCESKLTSANKNNSSDLYTDVPFITCITKEPCIDITEQTMEVKIEISDGDVT